MGVDGSDEGAGDLGAGRVSAGVDDAVAVVPALAGEQERPAGVEVEGRAERDELAQAGRSLLAQDAYGGLVAQPGTGSEGVLLVLERGVVGTERCGHAALRPAGGAVVDADLGDDEDVVLCAACRAVISPATPEPTTTTSVARDPAGVGSEQARGARHQTRVGSSSYEPVCSRGSLG